MTAPASWRGASDPAILFLRLWAYANRLLRDTLANSVKAPGATMRRIGEALLHDDPAAAVAGICDAIDLSWTDAEDFTSNRGRAGLALAAMRAIDAELLQVHPRSLQAPPAATKPLPSWLETVRERRTMSGIYGEDKKRQLIARGPLARSTRLHPQESTFLLGDQFAALSVVKPEAIEQDGKVLGVEIQVIGQAVDTGVPARPGRTGREKVTFVPLAEQATDLVVNIEEDAGTTFLDCAKGAGFDPRPAFSAAAAARPDSDILIAPELTVDSADVESFSAMLNQMASSSPRLVVTGSATIPNLDGELPWNEAVMLNGNGALLWAHRKMGAYAMQAETAQDLNIPGTAGGEQLMERIAWSERLTVADIDGLGRVIVLICQDLMMEAVPEILKTYRPDWVLVPILDWGTSMTRWPGRRVTELAANCEARFVVVSSLTMKHWLTIKDPGDTMGIAVGPKYINAGDRGRDERGIWTEVSPEGAARRHATIEWRGASGWSAAA